MQHIRFLAIATFAQSKTKQNFVAPTFLQANYPSQFTFFKTIVVIPRFTKQPFIIITDQKQKEKCAFFSFKSYSLLRRKL